MDVQFCMQTIDFRSALHSVHNVDVTWSGANMHLNKKIPKVFVVLSLIKLIKFFLSWTFYKQIWIV